MILKNNLQSNLWKYTLLLISNKRIFIAILGAYYLTIPDVTAKSIGLILFISDFVGFLLEIPSGYISDKLGHKYALVTSRLLMFASTLFFLFANNFIFLVLGGVFLSASRAFQSGTGSAFMYNTLSSLNRENEYAKIMGKISSIGFAVPILLSVLTPFLVSYSFKLPFLVSLATDIIGLIAALALISPTISPKEVEEIKLTNFRQVIGEGHRLNFFILALFSGIVGGITISVGLFRAPYQVFLSIPVIWYGVFFGIGRAMASLMLAYSGKLKEKFTLLSLFKFQMIIFSLFLILLGFITEIWVVVAIFILINAFQWGLSNLENSYLLEKIKLSKFKATLLSLKSQIELVVVAISSLGLGFLIDQLSYQVGFLYTGLLLFTILFLLYFYISRKFGNLLTRDS